MAEQDVENPLLLKIINDNINNIWDALNTLTRTVWDINKRFTQLEEGNIVSDSDTSTTPTTDENTTDEDTSDDEDSTQAPVPSPITKSPLLTTSPMPVDCDTPVGAHIPDHTGFTWEHQKRGRSASKRLSANQPSTICLRNSFSPLANDISCPSPQLPTHQVQKPCQSSNVPAS